MRRTKTLDFILVVFRRFHDDGCLTSAASLSYTSLLAITPVLAIAFSVLSAFPAFQEMGERLQELMFSALVPATGQSVEIYLRKFIQNAHHSTLFGITSLSVTSVLLLLTIQSSFDAIWKTPGKRTVFTNLLTFWGIITLGPLLLGSSLSLSSYLFAQAKILNIPGVKEVSLAFLYALPSLMEWLAFFLLYIMIPSTSVRGRQALVGSAIATTLFELLKIGFGAYVTHFPFYQVLYGTLATIPIFLIWLYLSWAAALLGAEIVATLPERSFLKPEDWKNPKNGPPPTLTLLIALEVLYLLHRSSLKGKVIKSRVLLRCINSSQAWINQCLFTLSKHRYIVRTEGGAFTLCRDLGETSLLELYRDLGLGFDPSELGHPPEAWIQRLKLTLEDLELFTERSFQIPILEVLRESREESA